jgi:Zn-finger protein
MSFDSIPEDKQECFPCECGGNIVKSKTYRDLWECDTCEIIHRVFRETVDMKTGKTTDVRPASWIMLGQAEVNE